MIQVVCKILGGYIYVSVFDDVFFIRPNWVYRRKQKYKILLPQLQCECRGTSDRSSILGPLELEGKLLDQLVFFHSVSLSSSTATPHERTHRQLSHGLHSVSANSVTLSEPHASSTTLTLIMEVDWKMTASMHGLIVTTRVWVAGKRNIFFSKRLEYMCA